MTWRSWECGKCGHRIPIVQIQEFIRNCPKCGAEYKLIGYVGDELRTTFPLSCLKEAWPDNAGIDWSVVAKWDRIIVCEDEETARALRPMLRGKGIKVKVDPDTVRSFMEC